MEALLGESRLISESFETDRAELKRMTNTLKDLNTTLLRRSLVPEEGKSIIEESMGVKEVLEEAIGTAKVLGKQFSCLSYGRSPSNALPSSSSITSSNTLVSSSSASSYMKSVASNSLSSLPVISFTSPANEGGIADSRSVSGGYSVNGGSGPREVEDLTILTEEDGVDTEFIKFETENTQNIPIVRAAAIPTLIERLTFEKYPDMTLQKTFLLTFRSFMTPYALMESLVLRYCATPRQVRHTDDLLTLKKTRQVPLRLRVLNVIKYWIDNHAYDFEDPKVNTLFNFFMTNIVSNQQLAQSICAALKRKLRKVTGEEEDEETQMLHSPPDSIIPVPSSGNSLGVLDFHPLEIARQLTLIEFQLYRAIKPKELMNQSWSKLGKEKRAPNVLAFIDSLNKTCKWVVQEIVTERDLGLRVRMLKVFISVGVECFKMNNFNGGMEILAGLSNSAVTRLKKTWEGLDQTSKESFQSLSEFPEKNFKKIREALRQANPPCVPYLGIYLSDLTFLEDGNPDRIEGDLINFWKLARVAALIQEIQQFQAEPYSLNPVPEIKDYLLFFDSTIKTDAELFQDSLRSEPRATT